MKLISSLLLILLASCAGGKEVIYIGSTPANSAVVRSFLGIPLSDSVDFIKWKLYSFNDHYTLQCQFGISKPNTDGFTNEDQKVEVKGQVRKEKNFWYLHNGSKVLKMLELNSNLLHLLDNDNNLLVGNSGWSYTINSNKPASTDQVNIFSKQNLLKDSMAFEGRTPCHDFPEIHPSPNCVKKKWYVILYADPKTNQATTYHLNGNYRREGGTRGTWNITKGKDGRIIYQLYSEKENASIYLLKLDENILVFTDAQGNLLVGDKNFSFTLNKRW